MNNEENKKSLIEGWRVGSQTPIDDRIILNAYEDLLDLGPTDVDAYRYYEGLKVYVLENEREYAWVESTIGALPTPFTYPSNIVVNGITYSDRTFNFVKTTFAPKLTDIDVYTIDNLININYTSGDSIYFPAKNAKLTSGTLSVFPTLQGITPYVGMKVLVKEQTDKTKNGDYVLTRLGNGATEGWELKRLTYMNDDFYPRMWLVRQGPDAYKLFSQRNTQLITDQLGINGDIIFGFLELGTIITPDVKILDTTHEELVALVNSGSMIKGSLYRITDYQTIYDQPDYIDEYTHNSSPEVKMGPEEPLTVLALTNSILHCDAYQENWPKDTLKYQLVYNCRVSGTETKGRIYERIDDRNNRTDFDHRHVYFKRYIDDSQGDIEFYANGNVIRTHYPKYAGADSYESTIFAGQDASNNYIYGVWETLKNQGELNGYRGTQGDLGDAFDGIKFDLPNIILDIVSYERFCENNKFLDTTYNVTIHEGDILNNTVSGKALNVNINCALSFTNNNFKEIIDCIFLGLSEIDSNNIGLCYESWLAGGSMLYNNINFFRTIYYTDSYFPKVLKFNFISNNINVLKELDFAEPSIYLLRTPYTNITSYYDWNLGTLFSGSYSDIYLYDDGTDKVLGYGTIHIDSNGLPVYIQVEQCVSDIKLADAIKIKTFDEGLGYVEGAIPSTSAGYIRFNQVQAFNENPNIIQSNNFNDFLFNKIGDTRFNSGATFSYNTGDYFIYNNIMEFRSNTYSVLYKNKGIRIDNSTFKHAEDNDFGPLISECEFGHYFGSHLHNEADLLLVDDGESAINNTLANVKRGGNIILQTMFNVKFGDFITGNKFDINIQAVTNTTAVFPVIIIPSNFRNNTIEASLVKEFITANYQYLFDYPQLREIFPVHISVRPQAPIGEYEVGDNINFEDVNGFQAQSILLKKEDSFDGLKKYTVLFVYFSSGVGGQLQANNLLGNITLDKSKTLKNYNSVSGLVNTNKIVEDYPYVINDVMRQIKFMGISLGVQTFILSKEETEEFYLASGTLYPFSTETRTFLTSSEDGSNNMWAFNFGTGLSESVDKFTPLPALVVGEYTVFNKLMMQYTDTYGSDITIDITEN